MPIWTDSFLNQLTLEAGREITKRVKCLYIKVYLPTVKGQSLYTLSAPIRDLSRITWLGKKLDAVSFTEMQFLTPATVQLSVGNVNNVDSTIGRPLYYCMQPTGPYDIRLFPTPDLTLGTGTDPYSLQPNEQFCVASGFQHNDQTLPSSSIPKYIFRRTMKAYVLARAFASEGKGQSLKASQYYDKKFEFLINQFIEINNGAYIGKRYEVSDSEGDIDGFRYPKPILPSRFETVIFK